MAIFKLCKLTTFAYLDCSIFLICCSGWVWEAFPTNKVSVAILSRLGDFGLRLTVHASRNNVIPLPDICKGRVAWGMTAPLREKGNLDMIGSR